MPGNTSGRTGRSSHYRPGRRGLLGWSGRSGRTCTFACLGLLLLSCRPPPPAPPPLPVEVLLQEIDTASSRLQDFRGSAVVETSYADRRGRAALRIRFLNPARFRIDVHGTLFRILAVILIQDLRVQLYMPRENTVFEGTLEARGASIPGLDLTLDDVHAAVTGTIAPGRYPGLPVADYRRDGDKAVVTLGDDSGRRTLWIDTGRMTVTREASEFPVNRGDVTESITRTFERFRNRNGVWRPDRVRITRDGPGAGTFELTYRTQSVNRGLRPSDIGVRLPESVVRRPLEEAVTVFETVDGASDPGRR